MRMNVNIIYNSQTGNTRKVALAMEEAFRGAGHTVRAIPLKKAAAGDASACDLLGIGAPCYANQAAKPIRDFIDSLPRLDGMKAFVFATSGEAPGRTLYDMASRLRRKGAEVVGGFLARGELFYTAPCLIGRFAGRPDENDLEKAREFAVSLGVHVSSGREGPLPGSRPDALKPGWGFYDFVGLTITDGLMRLTMPKPKFDETLCDGCGRCVSACPTGNIVLDEGFPVLGKDCIRCHACLHECPNDAITVSWKLGNPLLFTLYNTKFATWFGDLEPGEEIYPSAR